VERLHVLIVDDEQAVRDGIRMVLEYAGISVDEAASGEEGLESIGRSRCDVVLLDLRLPKMGGLAVLERLSVEEDRPQVIMISAHADLSTAVQATRLGAFDFLEKPLDQDRLLVTVRNAGRQHRLMREARLLRRARPGLDSILGISPVTHALRQAVALVAATESRALITGESGTGKELVARAIHAGSARAAEAFVEVNCAALPAELIESELFGHEKGAFTGAYERRIGRFEQAQGGTLFLDEIGEIDAATQVKLLRFLGERTFERVGSNKTLTADVRLIAATNRDLAERVKAGGFREDLFFRLRVVEIHLPALRERTGDIPLLALSFLREFARENGKPVNDFTADALELLMNYSWPGNVRELRAAIEHAVVLCRGEKISARDLPPSVRSGGGAGTTDPARMLARTDLTVKEAEKQLIIRALKETKGNRTLAAKKIGMSRRTFHRKLHTYHLEGF